MGAIAKVKNGQENYETFKVKLGKKTINRVQYDYRTQSGELFSCVAKTLDIARKNKNEWLKR